MKRSKALMAAALRVRVATRRDGQYVARLIKGTPARKAGRGRKGRTGAALALMLALATSPAAGAQGQIASAKALPDGEVCLHHIAGAEKDSRIPKGLLAAIGLTESGRTLKGGRRAVWPWTVNAAGEGRFFDNKEAAIAFVEEKRADGVESIDVGCMQINLKHHPDAFASLDDAFDPETNVAYAATFLTGLHGELKGWLAAARRYHSATPEKGEAYGEKVLANWSGAAKKKELAALAGDEAAAAAGKLASDGVEVATANGFLRATPVRVVTGSGTMSLFAAFYSPPPGDGTALPQAGGTPETAAAKTAAGGSLFSSRPKLIQRRVAPGETGLTLQDYRTN